MLEREAGEPKDLHRGDSPARVAPRQELPHGGTAKEEGRNCQGRRTQLPRKKDATAKEEGRNCQGGQDQAEGLRMDREQRCGDNCCCWIFSEVRQAQGNLVTWSRKVVHGSSSAQGHKLTPAQGHRSECGGV